MNSYTTLFKVNHGKNILPIKRMEIFSADEWEIFVEEWLEIKRAKYIEVERFGGAGDKGRDVAAYITDNRIANYKWDCYQCKHYNNPLMPSQMWIEFGKLLYYTFKGEYPVPNKYYFISPKGCGTSFTKLLQNPADIKKGLIDRWDKDVSEKIIAGIKIDLANGLLQFVKTFDYTIFDRIQPKVIIEEHQSHPNHSMWFGGGLPDRSQLDETLIPDEISNEETVYVEQLILAYGSDSSSFYSLADVKKDLRYSNHFKRARISFHHAEQLRNFSRDNLPNGTFETFQDEIYTGVINIAESNHSNGFSKVKAVETHSSSISITSNALKEVSNVKDKTGVCHQLCNDKRLNWI